MTSIIYGQMLKVKINVMPTITVGSSARKCSSTMHGNEGSIVRQETDIASTRTDDVTHGSSYAGNKNAVRGEKKNTIEAQ